MTSKLARNFQRQEGAEQAAAGFIGNPLRLPFARILQEARAIRPSDAYRKMVIAGACALTLGQAEDLYLDTIRGLDKHDLDVIVRAYAQLTEDMECRPYMDILGPVYMEMAHKLDRDARGEFYTPHALCHLLSRMLLQEIRFEPGVIPTANEPASGTGAIVLAAAENLANQGISPMSMRWTLQDISQTACYGAYINTTLWGIPATVICGDTLRMTQNWAWHNIHWFNAHPHIPTAAEYMKQKQAQQEAQKRVDAMREFISRLPEAFRGVEEAV